MVDSQALPNFMIVGAAKSGTTSLYHYLNQHQDVFLSNPKEPKYFSNSLNSIQYSGPKDDIIHKATIKDFETYIRLFNGVKDERKIGEASVDNLYYHKEIIPLIKSKLGDIDIIIMLRNPVERAFSSYMHCIRGDRETLTFEEALKLEEERIAKGWEFIWHYKNAGLYYEQVNSYMNNFTNCNVYLFDDLIGNSDLLMKKVCEDLNISFHSFNTQKMHNVSGRPVSSSLSIKVFQKLFAKDNSIKKLARRVIPVAKGQLITQYAKSKLFDSNLIKENIKPKTRQELIKYFEKDVLKLEKLIGRDLSLWLK